MNENRMLRRGGWSAIIIGLGSLLQFIPTLYFYWKQRAYLRDLERGLGAGAIGFGEPGNLLFFGLSMAMGVVFALLTIPLARGLFLHLDRGVQTERMRWARTSMLLSVPLALVNFAITVAFTGLSYYGDVLPPSLAAVLSAGNYLGLLQGLLFSVLGLALFAWTARNVGSLNDRLGWMGGAAGLLIGFGILGGLLGKTFVLYDLNIAGHVLADLWLLIVGRQMLRSEDSSGRMRR